MYDFHIVLIPDEYNRVVGTELNAHQNHCILFEFIEFHLFTEDEIIKARNLIYEYTFRRELDEVDLGLIENEIKEIILYQRFA